MGVPDRIYKLQPDRTVSLRGFDSFGAAAAVHSASASSFQVSGVFRDPADFAVVLLYDADDFYNHPFVKPLPDFDFSGLTLQFDLAEQNLMPINCRKYPTIDWPYLGVEDESGGRTRVRLSDYAVPVGGSDEPATSFIDIAGDAPQAYDRVTLWYLNLAFDYIVPGATSVEYSFAGGTTGSIHSVLVRDRAYTYTQGALDSAATVVSQLAAQITAANDPDASAAAGSESWLLKLSAKLDTGDAFPVSASGNSSATVYHVRATTAARSLADQINATDFPAAGAPFALQASVEGTRIHFTTVEPGYDANFVKLYATFKNDRLAVSPSLVEFNGGVSNATLRVTLDFLALGITSVRRMWFTFAPRLTAGGPFVDKEWSATFSNWTVAGDEEKRRLRVAGPGSVRVSAMDSLCSWQGAWTVEEGFYYSGYARVAPSAGASVTVMYTCTQPHSLWLGTALQSLGAEASVQIDGLPAAQISTRLTVEETVLTRRRLALNMTPGSHTIILTTTGSGPFCFNFIEAAVESDVPDALLPQNFFSPALDYSTDHTYKLPPARIHWIYDKLGFTGPMNEYVGVFWWNQRKPAGGHLPSATVRFAGEFAGGDKVFVRIGDQDLGKSVFPADTRDSIARHFEIFINSTLTGVRALANGPEFTMWPRSTASAFQFPLTARIEHVEGSTGAVSVAGSLLGGVRPEWDIDPDADEPLNVAARAWHADFYREAAARGRVVTSACSMELVRPPVSFAARFPDGQPVGTAVGFAGLVSTHCAFRSEVLAYQAKVYRCLASLMQEAGQHPDLQFGEFSWWYFSNWSATNLGGGMAYYDGETQAAALVALGRPLALFRGADDDPTVSGSADAAFLAHRLQQHVASLSSGLRAAFPNAKLEVLFPYDVNHPTPAGVHQLGGRLNRAVNFPQEWASKASSGLDRLKVEALDFGAWSRDLDLVMKSLRFPIDAGWPPSSVRVMVPVFRGGYPWHQEVEWAKALGMDFAHLWAFDHFCLHGNPLVLPGVARSGMQG